MFVVKLNSLGAVVWVTQLGATTKTGVANANQGSDECYGVAVDSIGNVYCAGSTGGNLGEVSGGNTDLAIAKLSSSGALVSVFQFGSVTQKAGVTNAHHDAILLKLNTDGLVGF